MSVSPATPEPRPLSYWLEAGDSVPASERTVLRTMAYRWIRRRTQILNLWLATAFFTVLLLMSRSPDVSFPPEPLWLAVICFGLAAIGYTVYHRRRLPSYEGPDRDVWIRTTRGGVLGAVAFVIVIVIYVLTSRSVGSSYAGSWTVGILAVYSLVISVKLIWQGRLHEHANTLFRDHVEKDARTRTALEDFALDPPRSGDAPRRFGPL